MNCTLKSSFFFLLQNHFPSCCRVLVVYYHPEHRKNIFWNPMTKKMNFIVGGSMKQSMAQNFDFDQFYVQHKNPCFFWPYQTKFFRFHKKKIGTVTWTISNNFCFILSPSDDFFGLSADAAYFKSQFLGWLSHWIFFLCSCVPEGSTNTKILQ